MPEKGLRGQKGRLVYAKQSEEKEDIFHTVILLYENLHRLRELCICVIFIQYLLQRCKLFALFSFVFNSYPKIT